MRKVDNKVEPISAIDTESKQDIRPSTRIAFAQENQIYQKNGISSLHYFSWLSDVFLSTGAIAVMGVIPTHNILEEPSYWYGKKISTTSVICHCWSRLDIDLKYS